MRHEDEGVDPFPFYHRRERPDLGPGAERSDGDRLGTYRVPVDVYEEVPLAGLDALHQVHEPSVSGKAESFEPPPLEPANAENEPFRPSFSEELEPEALARLPPGKDENGAHGPTSLR